MTENLFTTQDIPPGSQVLIFTATADAEVIKAADIQAQNENKE